jgi:uncharacterized protein YbaR (Trm112 family)
MLALTQVDLRLLVCPVCRQSLMLDAESVCCTQCARRYPILDGIPILLADRVQP